MDKTKEIESVIDDINYLKAIMPGQNDIQAFLQETATNLNNNNSFIGTSTQSNDNKVIDLYLLQIFKVNLHVAWWNRWPDKEKIGNKIKCLNKLRV